MLLKMHKDLIQSKSNFPTQLTDVKGHSKFLVRIYPTTSYINFIGLSERIF